LRLLGKPLLLRLIQNTPRAHAWVSSWTSEVSDATWKQATDVRQQFPRVLQPSPNEFAFPVAELPFSVVLNIEFVRGIAVITRLLNRNDPHGS
jgi:mRNA-degrading endonuclease HigB of HigAB toxin-antitoxin module